MIDIEVAPDALVCGRATEVIIGVANRSPEHSVFSVVVEFEPDGILRLDGGDCRIEVDELRPRAIHQHRVTLTGRTEGLGHLDVPFMSYLMSNGLAVSPSSGPIRVRVDPEEVPDRPEKVKGPAAPDRVPPPVPSTFISHRHADSGWLGQHLRARLSALLPGSRLFLDQDDLAPGEAWPDAIDRELGRALGLVALIGPRWETVTDQDGNRRLLLASDVVRHEIAAALERRILIIPVLHGRTGMPSAEDLPPELEPLLTYQAIAVDHHTQTAVIRRIAVQLRGAGLR